MMDAAKSATRPTPSVASSRTPTAAASPSAAAVCVVCGKGGAKLRVFCRCRSLCCSLACLQQHRASAQCAAICSLPPLTIGDEDRITVEEIELHWPRLKQRMMLLRDPKYFPPIEPHGRSSSGVRLHERHRFAAGEVEHSVTAAAAIHGDRLQGVQKAEGGLEDWAIFLAARHAQRLQRAVGGGP